MSESRVTLVTKNAAVDDLTEQDYRDIYVELREHRSLREFIQLCSSTASPSWWSQYEAGTKTLNWERKVELRRGVGYPVLPLPVERVAEQIDPNATVWKIGQEDADRVVLVGSDVHDPINLRVNSHLTITNENALQRPDSEDRQNPTHTEAKLEGEENYTGNAASTTQNQRSRARYFRPCLRGDKLAAYLAWSAQWDAEHEA